LPGPRVRARARAAVRLAAGSRPVAARAGTIVHVDHRDYRPYFQYRVHRGACRRRSIIRRSTLSGVMTMQQHDWVGVFSAITTPFASDLSVDHVFLREHASWLVDNGCTGIVALGSLGESATLSFDEKVAILESCRRGVGDRAPVVAGIAGLSTSECVALARRAEDARCDGLMVLPPYVYRGDWRETRAHFSAVIEATSLSCMLYNNPIAYGTDVSAEQL